jgi:hypothetical protein
MQSSRFHAHSAVIDQVFVPDTTDSILDSGAKDYYQAFFWVLIHLIVELLGFIIKHLIIKSFDTII